MATYIATTNISSNSGASYPITLKIRVNNKAHIRSIEVIECENALISLRPWQWLDLLAKIMPRFVYAHLEHIEVALGENPIKHPYMSYTGHPCLVVTQKDNGGEKRYRLNHCVNDCWALTINSAHLRAMVYWWRCNRHQYEKLSQEWGVWKNEE